MEPEHYRFGGGSAVTMLHPVFALAMILAVILILFLPKKYVLAPLLLAIFLIPKGQVVVLAGLHFNVYRIVLLAALARWVAWRRGSGVAGGFNSIDWLFAACALSLFVVFSLQYFSGQAIVKGLGDLLDSMGGYFVFRFLIRDREDVRYTIKLFALIAVIMGACMLNEQRTGQNLFGLLDSTLLTSEVRNGTIRSQGAFLHPIPAGAFGATLIPLVIWLWSDVKSRKIAVAGFLGASVMAVTCHSSTTLICYAGGIFALSLWPLRKQMRVIRWGLLVALIALHLVMKGPVWSLLEHINLTGSSENFHRYQLIDTFIRHFGDWWLLGTRDNGSWGWEMADTSNQYVTVGIAGGLTSFVLFIALICKCLGKIGTARRAVGGKRAEEWFYWCLGASLFAHLVVFFGIDYFDQMEFAWFALLAIIAMPVALAKTKASAKLGKAVVPEPMMAAMPGGGGPE
jgi:hypothetical protein